MTVFITGAGGFVGTYLIEELQKSSPTWDIIAGDTSTEHISTSVESVVIDLTSPASYETVLKEKQPDWIVHLAAVSSVPFAIAHPDLTRTINVFGTQSLLESAATYSPHTKCLVISSADVYGHVSSEPLVELSISECHPANPYAASKLEMEQMIEGSFNDRSIRVRPFPHIGPRQRQGFVTADFAAQIATIEQGKQPPVISVGNLSAIRDFTDVRDVVRAYRLLMESGQMGQVYHVGSGVGTSIQSILDQLLSLSSTSITIEQDASRMRPSDNPVMIANIDKISTTLGWKPEIQLNNSLSAILDYWRNKE